MNIISFVISIVYLPLCFGFYIKDTYFSVSVWSAFFHYTVYVFVLITMHLQRFYNLGQKIGFYLNLIFACGIDFICPSDDPRIEHLKPAVLKDFLEESSVNENTEPQSNDGLAPDTYCTCGQCTYKPTLTESICCKSINTSSGHVGKTMLTTLFIDVQSGAFQDV